ncbi:MAG: Yip1 family protein [Caulobacteraceae bacterium]
MELNISPEKKTLLQKMKLFFIRPTELFRDYRERPTWALKLLIISVVTALFTLAVKVLSKDLYVELLEKKAAGMSPEQADAVRASAGFLNSPLVNALSAVFAVISIIAVIFILALVYMALVKMFGGQIKYMQAVSVYTLAYIATCIGMVFKVLFMYVTGNLIYANLEPTYTDVLFNSLDPFIIWQAILMVFGLSIVGGIPEKKSTIIVVIMWLLSMAFSMGMVMIAK